MQIGRFCSTIYRLLVEWKNLRWYFSQENNLSLDATHNKLRQLFKSQAWDLSGKVEMQWLWIS